MNPAGNRCPCGKVYTDAELRTLPVVGRQHLAFDATLCTCAAAGSTIERDHVIACEAHGYTLVLVNCTCAKPTTFGYEVR